MGVFWSRSLKSVQGICIASPPACLADEALAMEVAIVSHHESPTDGGSDEMAHTAVSSQDEGLLEVAVTAGLVLGEPIAAMDRARTDGPGKAPGTVGVWLCGLRAPLGWSSCQPCQHDEGTPKGHGPADRRQGLAPASQNRSGVEQADHQEAAQAAKRGTTP